MSKILVKIGRESIEVDKASFTKLLDFPAIKDRAPYRKGVTSGSIKFDDLKLLAIEAQVPYPLIFASTDVVTAQIQRQEKELSEKLPCKQEVRMSSRGRMRGDDVLLIVKDISRKQEILKKRLLPESPDNEYIGSLIKKYKKGASPTELAEHVREKFEISLSEFRGLSKKKSLDYLISKLESKNVFVSRSSYNYMPQNIDPGIRMSGMCIKDKKFPFIFLNTRDGDKEPLIFETDGRQVFTLCLMLVSIGMNKFLLSSNREDAMSDTDKSIFNIAGEVLLPLHDINNIRIASLDELEASSRVFSVTPSMLLMRLRECGLISEDVAKNYFVSLRDKLSGKVQRPRQPTPERGYAKYNGGKFSKEVLSAYSRKRISHEDACMSLFKRRRMPAGVFSKYVNLFKV